MRTMLSLLALIPGLALAGPDTMVTQGRLLDSTGNPLSGTFTITFELHDHATADSPQWMETIPNVQIADGYYAVELGSSDPLDAPTLSGDRWLSVTVGLTELSRSPLTAAPLALRAAGLTLNAEAGGTTPGGCTASEIGTLRYNSDRDLLEFCRSGSGIPAWSTVSFAELTGNDTTGRRYPGVPIESCQEYINDARYIGASTGDGIYWIQPGTSEEYRVWCDMTTESGGWLDVVKSFHHTSADIPVLTDAFWSGGGAVTASAQVNALATDGILLTTSQSNSHEQSLYLVPEMAYSSVRLSYRNQGAEGGNRCSSGSWIPLSGPGFNGGYTSDYQVPCAPGYTSCTQGSSELYRDAPFSVSDYSQNGIATTHHLAFSGSNADGNSSTGCARDSNIPASTPAWFVTKLLIR